jgi:hypothetical protein
MAESSAVPTGATRLTQEDMTTLPFSPRLQPPRLQRRRVSPNGVITLPFAARVALGFRKGNVQYLSFRSAGEDLAITPADERTQDAVAAGPDGVVRLPTNAHAALTGRERGHYDLEIFRQPGTVLLRRHDGA